MSASRLRFEYELDKMLINLLRKTYDSWYFSDSN